MSYGLGRTARQWRKSSRSSGNGACVEVAMAADKVAVRDSKDPGGPELVFSPSAWRRFVRAVSAGEFDLGRPN
jgi:hypothetical protein